MFSGLGGGQPCVEDGTGSVPVSSGTAPQSETCPLCLAV